MDLYSHDLEMFARWLSITIISTIQHQAVANKQVVVVSARAPEVRRTDISFYHLLRVWITQSDIWMQQRLYFWIRQFAHLHDCFWQIIISVQLACVILDSLFIKSIHHLQCQCCRRCSATFVGITTVQIYSTSSMNHVMEIFFCCAQWLILFQHTMRS